MTDIKNNTGLEATFSSLNHNQTFNPISEVQTKIISINSQA